MIASICMQTLYGCINSIHSDMKNDPALRKAGSQGLVTPATRIVPSSLRYSRLLP